MWVATGKSGQVYGSQTKTSRNGTGVIGLPCRSSEMGLTSFDDFLSDFGYSMEFEVVFRGICI